jgi:hypothetical protein
MICNAGWAKEAEISISTSPKALPGRKKKKIFMGQLNEVIIHLILYQL